MLTICYPKSFLSLSSYTLPLCKFSIHFHTIQYVGYSWKNYILCDYKYMLF
nr:MAG TPA: hypothetical protein [Caudoviricetes sp.]DAM56190.1 MAG TPA: hypothetical protein [Caudoviricetes sp.]DAX57649.1 MAG TPA: hypothetical protein [Crassvirales sp.]